MTGRANPICLFGSILALSPGMAIGQEKPYTDRASIDMLPPAEAMSAEESRASYEIDGAYKLELVAAEPLVVDPVDLTFDAQGRLFVAEMRDYPVPAEEGPRRCRIRMLEDRDGDGEMDTATTWADDLEHVNGLLPMKGGLLVTTHVDTLFLKDTDGDGVADLRELLFRSNKPVHSQHFVTSPHWGLDNTVNLNNGTHGKEIFRPGEPDSHLDIERRNVRYHPRTGVFEAVSGHGQFGASIDDWGHRFFCTNRNPVIFEAMPLVAMERNPYFGILSGNDDIAPSGGDAKVYPLTLTHTTAPAHAGTFTSACGTFVYRGDLLPELTGNALVCEPTGQLVVRFRLDRKGASLEARRVGERRDFLASSDAWSRPVNLRTGPDGALYICDMYQRFIDHPRFFPESFVERTDMTAGVDRGRIYRLVPSGRSFARQRPVPASAEERVKMLAHPNAWHRETAQRLLVEERAMAVAPALAAMLKSHADSRARVHALWTLHGLEALETKHVMTALGDGEAGVVENALLLVIDSAVREEAVSRRVLELCGHEDRRVRFLAMIALGDDEGKAVTAAMISALAENPEDPWIRNAVLAGAEKRAGEILTALLADSGFRENAVSEKMEVLREFGRIAGSRGELRELAAVFEGVAVLGEDASVAGWRFATLRGVAEGLRRNRDQKRRSLAVLVTSPPAELVSSAPAIEAVLDMAPEYAWDTDAPAADRLAALALVEQLDKDTAMRVVAKLIDRAEPVEIQEAAFSVMSRLGRNDVADLLFERWDTLGPVAQREALALLVRNSTTSKRLLKKMVDGEINPALVDAMSRWTLFRSKDEELVSLATELFVQPSADRRQVIEKYREGLGEAGDAGKGHEVFVKNCVICHRFGSEGGEVGPDISDVRMKTPEALLSDILDPSRAIDPQWTAYLVQTRDGRSLMGLLKAESAGEIHLVGPGLEETIPRQEVVALEALGQSLMPVGLETAMNVQEFADLMAYLRKR